LALALLGRPWGDILAGSQTHVFLNFSVYAAEWEAVLKQTVAKKELEL
jgi:hypothetical protein